MVNIQQFYAEEFAHKAALNHGGLVDVRWSSKVVAVRPQANAAFVDIESADSLHTVFTDWLVACDGGRSTVREQLGQQLEGTQYEGRYVMVDVVQKTKRDVERLAWFDPPSNPGSVQRAQADDSLLNSYSSERVMATRENIHYGAKSTEFMAPPNYGFKLLREAALRLATEDAAVSALLNPRQSTPVKYVGSALNLAGDASGVLRAGMPAPEAKLRGPAGDVHLSPCFGAAFVVLSFSESGLSADLTVLANDAGSSPAAVRVIQISSHGQPGQNTLVDESGQARARYGANEGLTYLVRPDGYRMGCWKTADAAEIAIALHPFKQKSTFVRAA